eukprot:SAG22_NODE_18693_length_282_cov_6.327869_1_plen_57_part_01
MKTILTSEMSNVPCQENNFYLLQVLSDNAFLRVERRGLDHPVDWPVFVVVREVRLVV